MLTQLKELVYEANMDLFRQNLVILTWGNVSAFDSQRELFVIKPSGIPYAQLRPADMVTVDLNGRKVDGILNPSSDTPTHAALYRRFAPLGVGGIVHTHSRWATIWAQVGRDIPAYGTTHADTFNGPIPCTRAMTEAEIQTEYEKETGNVIAECFETRGLSPKECPAVLVRAHGPFAWGRDAAAAVENALVLEAVANMAWHTEALPDISPRQPMPDVLKDKHFFRKHGKGAYYGQK